MGTMTRTLPVKLTQPELLERGAALALERQRQRDVEAAKKKANDEFKEDLEEIEAEIDRLAGIVHTQQEHRPVECEERRDLQHNAIEIVRLDTQEVVESHAMTADDRQTDLFDADARELNKKTAGKKSAEELAVIERRTLAEEFLALLGHSNLAAASVPGRFRDFCADRGVRGKEKREALWDEIKALVEKPKSEPPPEAPAP